MNLTYVHYAFLGLVVVAALAFAWVGKVDVTAAFGLAGTAAGIALPTMPSKADDVTAPTAIPQTA